MRRRARPAKAKVEGQGPPARKSLQTRDARVRDLEKRLAETREQMETSRRDLVEAREQQTATSELLKVIGRSTFDLQPVFDTLAANGVRLCGAKQASIFRFDGQVLRVVATHNATPELRAFLEQNPIPPGQPERLGTCSPRATDHPHSRRSSRP